MLRERQTRLGEAGGGEGGFYGRKKRAIGNAKLSQGKESNVKEWTRQSSEEEKRGKEENRERDRAKKKRNATEYRATEKQNI